MENSATGKGEKASSNTQQVGSGWNRGVVESSRKTTNNNNEQQTATNNKKETKEEQVVQDPELFKLSLVASSVINYLDSARELCRLSRVCKTLKHVIYTNDSAWQHLCDTFVSPLPPAITSDRVNAYYPPLALGVNTKLPYHSWKQVYQQLIQISSEWEEEKLTFEQRQKKWSSEFGGYACGMRCPSPSPAQSEIEMREGDEKLAGFPMHPAKQTDLVLSFSVDLKEMAAYYLNFLVRCENFAKNFLLDGFLQQATTRYINFMHLKHKYKNHTLIPTLEIEYVWVSHLLRPSMYIKDLTAWFGEVLDHEMVLHGVYLCSNKVTALKDTSELYEKEFGHQYCSEETIKKQYGAARFNTTGAAPLDPSEEDPASTSIGGPFSFPKQNKLIESAPAYVGELGTMARTKISDKPIGLKIEDLKMDLLWLRQFQKYMADSLRDPLDTKQIFESYTSRNNPSHMRTSEVYTHLWKAYEKFLYMAAKYPPGKGQHVHPSYAIDVIWHAHMLCHKIYVKETKEWVGYLVDHEPWPHNNSKAMKESSDNTNELWKQEFGIELHKEHTTRTYVKGEQVGWYY